MKTLILTYIMLLFCMGVNAQYTAHGKIEYERKMNIQRRIDDMEDEQKEWIQKMAQIPKFSTSYFDLYFNSVQTVYKPGRESENQSKLWFTQVPAGENIVHTNLKSGKVNAQKNIFEENFLVQDTMKQIKWRIMDEIRTIADFKCRKAVGKICDSVYVVAFYTEDIMVSGGPEMFTGLPGMILEIAVPRLATTWIATKVAVIPPKEADLAIPTKGKKSTQDEMNKKLYGSFKDWGKKNADKMIWWSSL